MAYLKWDEKTITDFSEKNINALYNQGYVFGRAARGYMSQTRSLRIDLSKFKLSSENRRVLKKTEAVRLEKHTLPCLDYHWSFGKLAKDFYETKFGKGTFSANKTKELMTDPEKSNFNTVFRFYNDNKPNPIGFCICTETKEMLHYCYPFYSLLSTPFVLPPNTGLGMMLKAIVWAQEAGKKYVYLGSAQRPSDTYKLQFAGFEWWDGEKWKNDLDELKNILK